MATYTNLTPAEFSAKLQADPGGIVLDVRTSLEHRDGHLPGAVNVSNIRNEMETLDKSKTYYVHCRVGGRSAVACQLMANAGFENVYNLNGKIEEVSIPLQKAG